MRKMLRYLLKRPLNWMANHFSAAPQKEIVFKSLTNLYNTTEKDSRVKRITRDCKEAKFIIFSDQHKGDKSAADDFKTNELNYIAALNYYNKNGFSFINLGDSEELWKFKAANILPANKESFEAEAAFQPKRLYKTFGNHDLIWKNKADVFFLLKKYLKMPLHVHEGIVLKLKCTNSFLNILLTHGHQGDAMSDNNWFSTWLVAHVWMPVQRFLRINVNTPSKDYSLRNEHNIMMSEWSGQQQNLLLITGHTHVPVFASGRYFNHPSNNMDGIEQSNIKPSYFNTGCCCFSDGDITGIEIEDSFIRLIKWRHKDNYAVRMILEEIALEELIIDLQKI
jgi:hypothetical protein